MKQFRTDYDKTMTAKELINVLEYVNSDMPVTMLTDKLSCINVSFIRRDSSPTSLGTYLVLTTKGFDEIYKQSGKTPDVIKKEQLKDSLDMQLLKEIRYMLELREFIIKDCKRCDLIESVLYDLNYAITEKARKIS